MADVVKQLELVQVVYHTSPEKFPRNPGRHIHAIVIARSVFAGRHETLRFVSPVLQLQKMSTPQQVEILTPRIQQANRVAFDYTGPGIGIGGYLTQKFGEYNPKQHKFGKIELCTFTNDLKNTLFSRLRMAFERIKLRIPINRVIREDLHSVHRAVTPGGNVTYRAHHTADGHADRCTGLALALHASSAGTQSVRMERVHTPQRTIWDSPALLPGPEGDRHKLNYSHRRIPF